MFLYLFREKLYTELQFILAITCAFMIIWLCYSIKEVNRLANIKSAKKRILVINKKTERNKAAKSRMRTSVRRFNEALATNERELAEQKFIDAQKIVQKTASKGSIHRNTARRKVARMAKALNKLA